MIELTSNQNEGWAVATINGKIGEHDFDKIEPVADGLIAKAGLLNGILLSASEFTGRENPQPLFCS